MDNNFLFEKYMRYESEEKLNKQIDQLQKELISLKKENENFKSSKPYKIWKKLSNFNNDNTNKHEIPNIKDIKVALIADQFTYDSYKYEFKVITINPDNWKKQFINEKPDIFFCESAWSGHNFKGKAPWLGKIYKNYRAKDENRTVLLEIIEYCQNNNIPTIFWNKEDPPHYRNELRSFAETANEFDYIFTSSKECIAHYKKDFNHPNVYCLMFAGQPKLFNPLNLSNEEIEEVVFAGTYYEDFPERIQLMDDIFDRLVENNIDLMIFDRQYYVGHNNYPERFGEYIHPPIEFIETSNVYKKMKWGLNFNIVTRSESMFARRVYELALSNVNIISNYSLAVDEIFGNNVFFFDKRKDLPDFNTDYEEQRLNNLYNVLENHTYKNRWKQILDTIGFEYVEDKNDISIIYKLTNLNQIEQIINSFNSINYDEKLLKIIVSNDCVKLDDFKEYSIIDSIFFSMDELKINTEFWIIVDNYINPDFIKHGIMHYQYLNNKISIAEGVDKFKLGIEYEIKNIIINKCNVNYLDEDEPEIDVYYI